jgi:exonuclease III
MAQEVKCTVLNWNAHRLNNPARRQVVRDLVTDNVASVICLQETKVQQLWDRDS